MFEAISDAITGIKRCATKVFISAKFHAIKKNIVGTFRATNKKVKRRCRRMKRMFIRAINRAYVAYVRVLPNDEVRKRISGAVIITSALLLYVASAMLYNHDAQAKQQAKSLAKQLFINLMGANLFFHEDMSREFVIPARQHWRTLSRFDVIVRVAITLFLISSYIDLYRYIIYVLDLPSGFHLHQTVVGYVVSAMYVGINLLLWSLERMSAPKPPSTELYFPDHGYEYLTGLEFILIFGKNIVRSSSSFIPIMRLPKDKTGEPFVYMIVAPGVVVRLGGV